MKYDTKEGKENIILGFIIFLLLVVICALLYINGYININRDNNMDINTISRIVQITEEEVRKIIKEA